MGYDENKSVKENLEDYATGQAWNNFIAGGGKVDDYLHYKKLKEEFDEKDSKNEND